MATNKYFRNYSYGREQRVEDDLTVEAIKIYGVDVQYMPRTIFNEIEEFGEDPLSKFDLAVPIEVYVNNLENFQGEGDFLSKFNLEIRDQITLQWPGGVGIKFVQKNYLTKLEMYILLKIILQSIHQILITIFWNLAAQMVILFHHRGLLKAI